MNVFIYPLGSACYNYHIPTKTKQNQSKTNSFNNKRKKTYVKPLFFNRNMRKPI